MMEFLGFKVEERRSMAGNENVIVCVLHQIAMKNPSNLIRVRDFIKSNPGLFYGADPMTQAAILKDCFLPITRKAK